MKENTRKKRGTKGAAFLFFIAYFLCAALSLWTYPTAAAEGPSENWDAAVKHILTSKSKRLPRGLGTGRKPLIVLDPGHGGQDPGAISVNGIYEKEITLAFAKKTKQLLEATEAFDVVLTRENDLFISLTERVQWTRHQHADLFISIHADSHENPDLQGMSVYTLSDTATDKETEKLAKRENKADLIMGVDLSTEAQEVANILLDLTQRETQSLSKRLAKTLIHTLHHKHYQSPGSHAHRSAAFSVLKAQDVPSVLIELGYLSNPMDLALLTNPQKQNQLCIHIADAIRRYFEHTKK